MTRPVHVEFLEGLGDDATSPGVIVMSNAVNRLPEFSSSVRHWDQWAASATTLKGLPPGIGRVIVGYSNGGSEVTQVAAEDFPIDLLISLDPTIWLAMVALHGNVKEAICFHNVNWASSFPPVGHASLTTAEDFKGTLRTIDTWDAHLNVDTDPVIQATVLAAIKQVGS